MRGVRRSALRSLCQASFLRSPKARSCSTSPQGWDSSSLGHGHCSTALTIDPTFRLLYKSSSFCSQASHRHACWNKYDHLSILVRGPHCQGQPCPPAGGWMFLVSGGDVRGNETADTLLPPPLGTCTWWTKPGLEVKRDRERQGPVAGGRSQRDCDLVCLPWPNTASPVGTHRQGPAPATWLSLPSPSAHPRGPYLPTTSLF